MLDLARDFGVELVVTLGSLLADVPHTRAAPVTGAADRSGPGRRWGRAVAVRGPTGSSASCRTLPRARSPAASLWAAVPHYVSLAPASRRPGALRPAGSAARRGHRHSGERRGRGGLFRAGDRGRLLGFRDVRLRGGARAAGGRATSRSTRSCPRATRLPRRSSPVPASAGRGVGRRRHPAGSDQPALERAQRLMSLSVAWRSISASSPSVKSRLSSAATFASSCSTLLAPARVDGHARVAQRPRERHLRQRLAPRRRDLVQRPQPLARPSVSVGRRATSRPCVARDPSGMPVEVPVGQQPLRERREDDAADPCARARRAGRARSSGRACE